MPALGNHMAYLTYDPLDACDRHRQAPDAQDGACVEFAGIVRGVDRGTCVEALEYDAYEPMAERLMARLVEHAMIRWALHQADVRHRLGRVAAGEVAVLVRVSAPHRDQAFEACRFLIEAIKHDVPIWKRELNGPKIEHESALSKSKHRPERASVFVGDIL